MVKQSVKPPRTNPATPTAIAMIIVVDRLDLSVETKVFVIVITCD